METYNFFHFFFFRPHTFYSPTSSQKIKIFLTFIRNGQKSVRTEIRARDKDLSPSLSSSIHVLHANKSFPCIYFLFLPFNSLMHVMIYKMFTFRQKLSRGKSGNEPPLIGAGARRKKKRQGERIAPLLFSSLTLPSSIHFPIELTPSKLGNESVFDRRKFPPTIIAIISYSSLYSCLQSLLSSFSSFSEVFECLTLDK